MAPRARPSPEIIEDVVVCAPLTASASRRTTRPPREVPCLGCLIVLVNWIPEDGHPFPCSDSESKSRVPLDHPILGTIVLTACLAPGKDDKCVRCARRSKSCYKAPHEDERKKARQLASVFNRQPLDLVRRRSPHSATDLGALQMVLCTDSGDMDRPQSNTPRKRSNKSWRSI